MQYITTPKKVAKLKKLGYKVVKAYTEEDQNEGMILMEKVEKKTAKQK